MWDGGKNTRTGRKPSNVDIDLEWEELLNNRMFKLCLKDYASLIRTLVTVKRIIARQHGNSH